MTSSKEAPRPVVNRSVCNSSVRHANVKPNTAAPANAVRRERQLPLLNSRKVTEASTPRNMNAPKCPNSLRMKSSQLLIPVLNGWRAILRERV